MSNFRYSHGCSFLGEETWLCVKKWNEEKHRKKVTKSSSNSYLISQVHQLFDIFNQLGSNIYESKYVSSEKEELLNKEWCLASKSQSLQKINYLFVFCISKLSLGYDVNVRKCGKAFRRKEIINLFFIHSRIDETELFHFLLQSSFFFILNFTKIAKTNSIKVRRRQLSLSGKVNKEVLLFISSDWDQSVSQKTEVFPVTILFLVNQPNKAIKIMIFNDQISTIWTKTIIKMRKVKLVNIFLWKDLKMLSKIK